MSDYSNDDGAPLLPRKGLHAKPEDLGSLVTDSVRSLITQQQPGERDLQNRGYSPQGPSPFSQQQEQRQPEWQQEEGQGAYRAAGAAYQHRMPSVNQFHEGFHAGAVDDFDTDFDAGPDGNAPEHDGVHRVRKKRHKGRRIALIVFAVLFTLIVGSGIALAAYVSSLNASMGFDDKQEEAELKEALQPASASESATEESTAFYMLILGSDSRDDGETASRSDVTMLARIDPDKGQVDLISIPRDTMVTIEDQGRQKINAAYSFGGASGAVDAVSTFAGVPITHYCEVHFDGLQRVVDELGGIWVNVPESFDAGNGGMSFNAGNQRLNGAQALAFARERYNVSGGDFGRAQAQRLVVQGIIKQVLASPPGAVAGPCELARVEHQHRLVGYRHRGSGAAVSSGRPHSVFGGVPQLFVYGRRRELRVPHVQRMARYDVSSRCGPRPQRHHGRNSAGPVEQLEAGRGKQFAGTEKLRCPGGKCGPYHKRCGS